MTFRTSITVLGLLGLLVALPAQSQGLPAPTEPLKDYEAVGVMHVELPPPPRAEGSRSSEVGFTAFYPFRQVYARPDRLLTVLRAGAGVQAMLAAFDRERVYNPANGFVVERIFKNMDPNAPSPMESTALSMAGYARALREVGSAKLLPAEDLDGLRRKLTERVNNLRDLRAKLAESKNPEDVPRAQAAAAEQARVRDDLDQLDLRKAHPCHIVEIPNRDLMSTLLSKGLVGIPEGGVDLMSRGVTRAWVTKAEGLPIKLETYGNDGKLLLFVCIREVRLNRGLHPAEIVLGAPPGTPVISATADLRDRNWQARMDGAIQKQIDAFDAARNPKRPEGKPKKPGG